MPITSPPQQTPPHRCCQAARCLRTRPNRTARHRHAAAGPRTAADLHRLGRILSRAAAAAAANSPRDAGQGERAGLVTFCAHNSPCTVRARQIVAPCHRCVILAGHGVRQRKPESLIRPVAIGELPRGSTTKSGSAGCPVNRLMPWAFDTLIATWQNGTGQAGVTFRQVDSADRAVFSRDPRREVACRSFVRRRWTENREVNRSVYSCEEQSDFASV